MKILIITSRFFPHGDAQCGVVYNLAEALKEKGCEVRILALTAYREDREMTDWNGIAVTQAYYPGSMVREEVRAAMKKAPLEGIAALAEIALGMGLRATVPGWKKKFINPVTAHAYEKAIRKILKKEDYDLCLPTLMPIDALHAAYRACRGKIRMGIYQLDTYWNNPMLPEKYREDRFAYEKELIGKSAFSLVLPTIAKSNLEKDPGLKEKMIRADMPVVKRPKQETGEKEPDGKIHCAYLGMLYPGLRPPEKAVQVIAGQKTPGVLFDFYGTRQDLIEKAPAYEKAKEQIRMHGPVSSEEAEKARARADVMVNIDNTSITQVPSKLFEYISTGKPIINFYFAEESSVLEYLSRYPKALNINLNGDLDRAAEEMTLFLTTVDGSRIPFEAIEKAYEENTPAYVAGQCMKAWQAATGKKELTK